MRKSIEDLCLTQDHALLKSLGIDPEATDISDDDSGSESDTITENPSELPFVGNTTCFISSEELNEILAKSQYNCFDVVSNSLGRCNGEDEEEAIIKQL